MTQSFMFLLRGSRRRLHTLGAALCLGGLGILSAATAHAQQSSRVPAGTTISTQATVSFTDSAGASRSANSTQVSVTVAQVGGALFTGGNTVSGGAGTKVTSLYTLANTGNGNDVFVIKASETAGGNDFQNIEIFAADSNGVPTSVTPLCTGPACATGVKQSVSAGASFRRPIEKSTKRARALKFKRINIKVGLQ